MISAASDQPLVILGAGLAGLSLGCALLDAGVHRPIVLVERREHWRRDRTWCTWDVRPMRFAEVADHRWRAWRIAGPTGDELVRAPATPYLHLPAESVYRRALDQLTAAPNVELHTGERVRAVHDVAGRPVTVITDRRSLQAAEVFDARAAGAGTRPGRRPGRVELAQRFLGWEVETSEPVFTPDVVTLMDFRAGGTDDLRFLYVLPFTSHRALIEDTSFGRLAIAPEERREQLRRDLRERLGATSWELRYEERGRIPMTDRRFEPHLSPRVHAIGIAGGAARPSSGYAFSRIQLQCDAIAGAIARGDPLPDRFVPRRRDALDAIFLHALARRPDLFPALFVRLARRTPPGVFARFMADGASVADELRVVAAMADPAFLAAAAASRATARSVPPRRP